MNQEEAGRQRGGARIQWDASLVDSGSRQHEFYDYQHHSPRQQTSDPPPYQRFPPHAEHLMHYQNQMFQRSPRKQRPEYSSRGLQSSHIYPPLPSHTPESSARFKRNISSVIYDQLDGLHVDRSLCEEKTFGRYTRLKKEAARKTDVIQETITQRKRWFGQKSNDENNQSTEQLMMSWGKRWEIGDWKTQENQNLNQNQLDEIKPDEVKIDAKFGFLVVPRWQKEILDQMKRKYSS
eukprot:TRINITY_DN24434_c0_g1_i1.p1 TRINITY_DN24434_c0_g1~~TRINITY_DN24434_c0_g1_i1.p1  ORF type:complete len:236 (-),score=31.34 TRINITY_DN24434_c0_g1_i1:172-879(-)